MNGFLEQIISRHIDTAECVKPRLPGLFEPGPVDTVLPAVNAIDNETTQSIAGSRENRQPGISGEKGTKPKRDTPELQNEAIHPSELIISTGKPNLLVELQQETSRVNNKVTDDGRPEVASAIVQPVVALPVFPGHAGQVSSPGAKAGMDKKEMAVLSATPPFVQPLSSLPLFHKNDPGLASALSDGMREEMRPVIKVSIGRIEVRAVQASQHATPRKNDVSKRKPDLSLDDYLQKRK